MDRVTWTDHRGRNYEVVMPPGVTDPQEGIVVGPYDVVDALGYPEPLASKLHNELHARGILTKEDVIKKSSQIGAAIQAVISIDVQTLTAAFHQYAKEPA